MSLPELLTCGLTASPSSGKAPLSVDLTDNSTSYDALEETGSATPIIVESGAETDTVTEGG